MTFEIIDDGVHDGPPAAIVVPGTATLTYFTGIGPGANPGDAGAWDAPAQARATVDAVDSALRDAGASWEDVVKIIEYVTDLRSIDTLRAALDERGGAGYRPARTLVQVDTLSTPGVRWELDLIAARPV